MNFDEMSDDDVMLYAKTVSKTAAVVLRLEREVLTHLRANPELMAKYVRSLRR